MDTELMVKMKIQSKLFFTYFIILSVLFIISTVMISLISENFLIYEARKSLKEEGAYIASELKKMSFQYDNLSEKISERKKLRVYGNIIDEKIIVLDNDQRLIYSNLSAEEIKKTRNMIRQNNDTKEYIVERVKVYDNKQNLKGRVILFTKLKNVTRFKKLVRRSQMLSFAVAGIFSLVIAGLLSRSITKPLKKLTVFMKEFSFGEKKEAFQCHTGDEIENLGHYFNEMTDKIYEYDEKQKSFLQNASHELKTPLMSIQGYAEAIKDGVVEEEEVADSLNIIIDESQRLKRIVDEIIFLTKVENAQEVFDYKVYAIGDVIKEVIEKLNFLANENHIMINQDLGKGITGHFDKDKLMRAFINVISNGIRYAENEVKIEIKESTSWIKILICDDGKGFDANEADKIFDRFYKGKNGSTGLGLAITKAVIEGHGGTIKARNSDSKGALFVISLPKRI